MPGPRLPSSALVVALVITLSAVVAPAAVGTGPTAATTYAEREPVRRVGLAPVRPTVRALVDRVKVQGQVRPSRAGVVVRITARPPGSREPRTFRVRTGEDGRYRAALGRARREGRFRVWVEVPGEGDPVVQGPIGVRVRAAFVARHQPVRRAAVRHSWRPGCPVGPSRLTLVSMLYRSYSGTIRWGSLVLARSAAPGILAAFERGIRTGFRIHHMVPVDRYRGSDPASMRANNTSAFNCRRVTGDPYSLSPHSYGSAVDLNPVQNPYVDTHGRLWPANGAAWRNRARRHPGMVRSGTPLRVAFGSRGFFWGGYWSHPDWQHFERAHGPGRAQAIARALDGVRLACPALNIPAVFDVRRSRAGAERVLTVGVGSDESAASLAAAVTECGGDRAWALTAQADGSDVRIAARRN